LTVDFSNGQPDVPAARSAADGRQNRTALMSVLAAAALVVLKLGTGLVSGSLGLVSAGIESSGDVVATEIIPTAIGALRTWRLWGRRPSSLEEA